MRPPSLRSVPDRAPGFELRYVKRLGCRQKSVGGSKGVKVSSHHDPIVVDARGIRGTGARISDFSEHCSAPDIPFILQNPRVEIDSYNLSTVINSVRIGVARSRYIDLAVAPTAQQKAVFGSRLIL